MALLESGGEPVVAVYGRKVAATAGKKCQPQQQHSRDSRGRTSEELRYGGHGGGHH